MKIRFEGTSVACWLRAYGLASRRRCQALASFPPSPSVCALLSVVCHTCGRRQPRAWRYGPIGIPFAGCSTLVALPSSGFSGMQDPLPHGKPNGYAFSPLQPWDVREQQRFHRFSLNHFPSVHDRYGAQLRSILRAFTCQVSNARVVDLGFG
ncbi:hypothetical protein BDQ17DRAFT_1372423 [Cyathus striatus]|nr:hypothetical protein BDQ17DRAFT_1372423 [Cyathus striatus]